MARIAAWLLFAAVGLGLAAALAAAVMQPAPLSEQAGSSATGASVETAAPGVSADGGAGAEPKAEETGTALLERLEPRAPLSGLASPAPPQPPPDSDSLPKRWRMVHQPVATAAGILEARGVTLVLQGIDVVAVGETCVSPFGQSWPCGMAARTAFRAFLRSRALNCRLPDARMETAVSAECLLQGVDPARWLISQGWTRAKAGGPFVAEAETAKAAQRGIFGQPPR